MQKDLILASASPRRKTLMQQLGLRFTSIAPNIVEDLTVNESCYDFSQRMAIEKAQAGYALCANQNGLVIAADTCGEIDGQLLAKPKHLDDARRLLTLLSGRQHTIYTGLALFDGDWSRTAVVTSLVTMRHISVTEIDAYWKTGEPQDKAGAYAIQGLGARFVKHLEGSYSAVMGLPLFELSQALTAYPHKIR